MKVKIFHGDYKTINDAWFSLLAGILRTDNNGDFTNAYRTGTIQRGSFEKEQGRLQFPGVAFSIEYPHLDRIVMLPEGSTVPAPTSTEKATKYFEEYILGTELKENEQYTYGQRLGLSLWEIIRILKATPITNQAVMEVARPEDIQLPDPPCLRLADCKVIPEITQLDVDSSLNDKLLTLSVYFRSWDLYAGLPENLAGLSMLQEFIAEQCGLSMGPMFCYSSGLHLYRYQKELAEMRTRLAVGEY